jgi:membrane protein DedA with SNARE-associated domain/membrane-associated phospholipid phosphatase
LISALRLDNRWVRWGLLAAIVIAFLLFRDQLPDFDLEEIIEDLSRGLGSWTYLLVAALAFLETGAFVGLVAPGEFTVILGGAVAGQGDISLPLILGITWLSAFLGDSVSFILGAKLGRGFLVKHGERVQITDERLRQVESYFARHGGKTILIGRFIGLVRALAPFIAGTSNMRYGAFAPYSVLGTGLWATTFILVGYFASQSLDTVADIVGRGLVYFGFFVGAVVGLIVLYRYLREAENRDRVAAEMERRRALRPLLALARRVRPQARFLWQRVTPGGLGLELTTLLAALAVGLFVLISYWSIVSGDPGPTGGDRAALDFFNDIRTGWLNEIAETVTDLGSGYVVFPLAVIAGVALVATRRWTELCVLVAGMALIVVFVHEIKDWTDRPRPAGGLVEVDGSSFPSAHAAYATIYTWLAATIAFRIVPGITRRSLVIAVGIAVTAVVGITRAYLRVHWLSDVLGGWALGVSCFAGAAAVALIFVHIRNNLRRDARPSQRGRGAPAGARH